MRAGSTQATYSDDVMKSKRVITRSVANSERYNTNSVHRGSAGGGGANSKIVGSVAVNYAIVGVEDVAGSSERSNGSHVNFRMVRAEAIDSRSARCARVNSESIVVGSVNSGSAGGAAGGINLESIGPGVHSENNVDGTNSRVG